MTDFTMTATIPEPYDIVVERVRKLLPDAGFGVLTEIDIQATLRAKLGVETPPQLILGACRPQLAHRALQADPRVATMLPCNVVVAAEGSGVTRVAVFDPALMASLSDAPDLADVTMDARGRLSAMMSALAGGEDDPDATRT
jgi:uncharacterized protein (DUF302 family)